MNYVRFGSINWIHIRIIRIRHVDGHAVCTQATPRDNYIFSSSASPHHVEMREKEKESVCEREQTHTEIEK